MPILQIDTNLPKASVPSNFRVKTCELLADIFEAPLNFCIVHINAEQDIYWYGLNGSFVLATLKIISGSGKISPDQNIGHAEKFVKHISNILKLPIENISVSFVEQEAANVTIFNTTVLRFLQNKN